MRKLNPSSPRILLLEDSDIQADLFKLMALQYNESWKMQHAVDAQLMRDNNMLDKSYAHADCVIMDITLPKKASQRFLKAFRERHDCDKIPMILMSESEETDFSYSENANTRYFQKPFDLKSYTLIFDFISERLAAN